MLDPQSPAAKGERRSGRPGAAGPTEGVHTLLVGDLTIAKGTLSAAEQQLLLDKVGRIAIDCEGLFGSKFAESFDWVYLNERPAAKLIYRFTFTTPCHSNS